MYIGLYIMNYMLWLSITGYRFGRGLGKVQTQVAQKHSRAHDD